MQFSLTSQLYDELQSVLHGYPDFVYSGEAPARAGHVPVFIYHTIDPVRFEADLKYLVENGYTAIGMNELVRHLRGERQAPENAVVLTFDDARSSFWRFGYPLLRHYQLKGVLFVIAGLTRDAETVRENLFSTWNGESSLADIEAIDPEDTTLCTWPELRAMYKSGWIEIESHSLFHQEVFVGTEIVDFLGPDSSYVPYQTSATAYLSVSDVGAGIVPEQYYGLPLFQTASLHSGQCAWEVSGELIQCARDWWRDVPVEARKNGAWRRWLRAKWDARDVTQELRRQDASDVERSITEDIAQASALIKDHVDRNAGDHFCLPYTVGSEVSVCVITKLDVKSCSWGVMAENRHNTVGSNPMRISRIKSDFVWRLPGDSQRSLSQVYAKKLLRRLCGKKVY